MMQLSDDDWKARLTPEQYAILRQKGTEPPFSGEHLERNDKGLYICAACGAELFSSDSKYDSKTPGLIGWPSFAEVTKSDAVELRTDDSFGMHRTEVICKKCGGHLGHVFDAGDSKSGKHYCINSCALDFKKQQK